MKQEMKVSVVMPVYNGSAVIRQAIDSVAAQQVPLELIIVDDCSTDNTAGIVKACQMQWAGFADKSLIYMRNKKNTGAAASRNAGVLKASAPWTAFLDADDWWTPDKLMRQLEFLEETGDVLCCTARELMDVSGKSLHKIIHVKKTITYKDLLFHNSINCSSVIVRTSVIRKFPMCYEDSHEDYITWLKILKQYGQACAIDEPMLKYRFSAGSKSGNKLKSAKMTFKVYRYMGFNIICSVLMFISYAVHGVLKYTGKKQEGQK